MDNKLKYVFIGNGWFLTKTLYNDLLKREDVIYADFCDDDKLSGFLDKIKHKLYVLFKKENKYVDKKRFKQVISHYKTLSKDENVCFIFFDLQRELNKKILRYNKRHFKNIKNVLVYTDTHRLENTNVNIDKKQFDFLYTYDKNMAEKKDLIYTVLPYSSTEILENNAEESDICFIGKPKTRFVDLVLVYRLLSSKGIRCNFIFTGVDEAMRVYDDKIKYVKVIPYEEVIKIIQKSNCMIEIGYQDIDFISQRVMEAVIYNKKILTNNSCLKNYKFFDERYISIFNNVEDIDIDFVRKKEEVKYNYNGEFSPKWFIEDLENRLIKN